MKKHTYHAALAALALTGGLASRLSAATLVFDGGTAGDSRSWNSANNWDLNQAPAAGDDLVIGGTALSAGFPTLANGNYMGLSGTSSTPYNITLSSVTFDNSLGQFPVAGLIVRNSSAGTAATSILTLDTPGIDAFKVQGGAAPSVTLNSRSSTAFLSIVLGYTGQANFSVSSGGTLTFDGVSNPSSGGTLLTGGGGITKTGAGTLVLKNANNDFTGGLTISSGTVEVDAPGRLGSAASLNSSAVVVNGGTLRFTGGTAGSSANRGFRVGSSGGTLQIDADVTTRIIGAIENVASQDGILVKTGAGTLSLEGASYGYSGGTTVSAGTLLLNQVTLGASAGTGLLVSSGATLRGGGAVNGATTLATGSVIDIGTYAAGALTNAVGELTFNSDLTLGDVSLFFDLDTTAASDRITLADGDLDIGSGTLDLGSFTFNTLGGFGAGTYTLVAGATSVVGTLGSNLTGTLGGFETALVLGNGGTTLDLVVTAIPEPSAIAVLAGALALGGALCRRRRVVR